MIRALSVLKLSLFFRNKLTSKQYVDYLEKAFGRVIREDPWKRLESHHAIYVNNQIILRMHTTERKQLHMKTVVNQG